MAMSQSKNKELALDLKPKTFRSGSPGQTITYIAVVKNLTNRQSLAKTWDVTCGIDSTFVDIEVADQVILKPQQAMRLQIKLTVNQGAEAGKEHIVSLALSSLDASLKVQRYFTINGGTKRPR